MSNADDDQLTQTFQRTVDDGVFRLTRSLPSLLATGVVGGADVAMGLFALLIVETETGNPLLAALAFSSGFIMLTLASSELFTENYLVPVAAVVARKASTKSLVRLWAGTLAMNLIGGWIVVGLISSGFPRLGPAAVRIAAQYVHDGIGWRSFSGALLGGSVITLMTWMERATESVPGKLLAAITTAFLLAAAPLNHVIVVSLELFAALQHGAPFGYLDWLTIAAWYTLGNMLGGLGLVSGLRLVQIGHRRLEDERERPSPLQDNEEGTEDVEDTTE
jgi:formate/nitrite transporter FocA (FNT family)